MNARSLRTSGSLLLACFALACAPAEQESAAARAQPDGARLTGPVLLGAVVTLGADELEHMGLEFSVPAACSRAPEVRAFGRVLDDPAASTTLRAPFAGRLLPGEIEPALGRALEAGSLVFRLAPRWTPQERADLEARAAGARGDVAALEAEQPALEAALERARTLNAQEKTVSDRELFEAQARLHASTAQLAAAREVLRVLGEARESAGALALVLPARGDVTELSARAGEDVEAGAPLLRVEAFDAPLLALDVPLGLSAEGVRSARVETGDGSGERLEAERIGWAPGAARAGLGSALLFRARGPAPGLRPGSQVAAWLALEGPAQSGVLVPSAAVVRLAGQAFVYARRGVNQFERLPLALERPLTGGWFADEEWTRSRPELVVRGAQNVLSCELLGRQDAEEED